jgi:hypothetical protein
MSFGEDCERPPPASATGCRVVLLPEATRGYMLPLATDSSRASDLAIVASMRAPAREAIRATFATVFFHIVAGRSKAWMSSRG